MKKAIFLTAVISLMLLTCGEDDSESNASYSIGGTLTIGNNLTPEIVLQNNGADDLTMNTGTGPFTFPDKCADGGTYAVTVKTKPAEYSCTASNGTGTVNGADVTDVTVTCSNTWHACTFPSECTSNICISNQCSNNGDSCTSAIQCTSNICTGGTCQP
jgi:hypothetical protein